jgi:hypothetical protein
MVTRSPRHSPETVVSPRTGEEASGAMTIPEYL